MKLGETATKRRIAAIVGSIVILLVSGVLFGRFAAEQSKPARAPTAHVWYYDLGADKLFEAEADELPPIAAPSDLGADGKASDSDSRGVRAAVYSCGDCADAKTRFIFYIEKYTPEARAALIGNGGHRDVISEMPASEKRLRGLDPDNPFDGMLIAFADPADPSAPASKWTWHPKADLTPDGLDDAARGRCADGQLPRLCPPTSP